MTPRRRKRILEVARKRQADLTVVLENVHDPHNLAAVLRSCDAVGIREVFVLHTEQDKLPKKFEMGSKTSAGARKWVDVYVFTEVATCFEVVKANYHNIWATHLGESAKSLYELKLDQPTALLFGNEHDGLSAEALSYADGNFIIPQQGMVESLNISVACAVSLFEAQRQRQVAGMYRENPTLQGETLDRFSAEMLSRHDQRYLGKQLRQGIDYQSIEEQ